MNTKTILEAAVLLGKVRELNSLLTSPDGNARWDALQEWLKRNPVWKKRVERWASMKSEAAMTQIERELAAQFSIPIEAIELFDPAGKIRGMIKESIDTVQ